MYCRLLSLDISGSGIQYNPGDIALVQPENLEDNVEFFFSLFPDLGLTLLLGTINDIRGLTFSDHICFIAVNYFKGLYLLN